MAKTKISEYDSNASGNTDINGININEGCPPSTINNSIRELMSQLKNMITGADGDSMVVGSNLTVNGTTTLTGNATAPTQTSTDNSTKVATTAYVQAKVGTLGTMSTQNANAVAITGGAITTSGTLAITGGLTLDGAAGTSGQFLTSTGAGNTPIWGGVSLGTMASQNANAVNITGGSITGLTTLSTSGGTISATTLTATTTLGIGAGWTAVQDGSNNLVFKYSGVNKMKIDSSGNLTVTGDITAFGTI